MSSPNTQHSDKWSIIFSNIPGYHPVAGDNSDMGIFDLYVKDMTFPELSIQLTQSHFRNYEISHQISKINDGLSDISITFSLSEGMMNYYHIFKWLQDIREMNNSDNEMWFRLNFIKEIKVLFLDNQKRPKAKHTFINGFITSLSSLTLTNGVDDELRFTITVKYEDYNVELVTDC